MTKTIKAKLSTQDEVVTVEGSELRLYTNGEGELFIETSMRTYRMKEYGGCLHVAASQMTIKPYHTATAAGILIS